MAKDANTHVHFDIDAVKIILDSGYSFTISLCREGCITFGPSVVKVKGLIIYNIRGKIQLNIQYWIMMKDDMTVT